MKRVNLTKYGFIRWPEEDFHDDGNNFTGYKAGKAVRVSKLVSDGQVYLSISSEHCGNGTLPYDIYSKLPYYNEATWNYNGVSVEDLTEDDLQAFYEACISYEKAYEEAEANIKYPTLEEIANQCKKLWDKCNAEYDLARKLIAEAVLDGAVVNLSEYEWKELRANLRTLKNAAVYYNPEEHPKKIINTSSSFDFVKPTYHHLANKSYYLEDIEKILLKLKNN